MRKKKAGDTGFNQLHFIRHIVGLGAEDVDQRDLICLLALEHLISMPPDS